MNGRRKHFDCYGRADDCLKCPLPDCIREMCVVDGEEITVSIKRDMAEYHREYYREKRKEYHREYYMKNKKKILERANEQARRKTNDRENKRNVCA